MSTLPKEKDIVNDAIIKDINEAVASLDYGTVEIKVQHARIVQVDVKQRQRFDDAWKIEEGSGI